jgi:precorrin-6B methylase 2
MGRNGEQHCSTHMVGTLAFGDFRLIKWPRDAAVGCLQCFQTIALNAKNSDFSGMPCLQALLGVKRKSLLNVLELGAGCGIAGIALAQTIPNSAVYLTDLPEAQDMLQKNVDIAKPAEGSSLRLGLLEWGSEITNETLPNRIDLVLISDCTYNADSCSALVQTLVDLAQHSKGLKVLLAMKRRHDAEAAFEYMMNRNGFHALECTKLAVPHRESNTDSTRPMVEIYLYERSEGTGT